ncbi:acyl carrier protein [Paenibacillus oenotherae]|uniref:Acyl carrier protein n=1 Tax=Paenibacillus oenotherae TaxID=1435645 RepID=A0ABS7D9A2_9BACL|nr:acyl carrier protein [Paenibacillus oenotherae]MBW7476508.1 acyl carrier protein [Paenibacillus oenotherae]
MRIEVVNREMVQQFLEVTIGQFLEEKTVLEPDLNLQDAGLDSVKTINLIVQIEKHFNIVFEDEEMLIVNFSTINHIIGIVLGKLEC